MESVLADLVAEYEALDVIVADLDEPKWNDITPDGSWTIKDEISHLAYFDRAAFLSATDPAAFKRDVEWMLEGFSDYDRMYARVNAVGNAMAPEDLLSWWRNQRTRLVDAFGTLAPGIRLSWYGPPLTPKNAITGRLMETWAHGRDIADTLGLEPVATDRLRHIAGLGVATFGWSFKNRQMKVPETPVRVELSLPSGRTFVKGAETPTNRVSGSALDFCLVVTQRRHLKDTDLDIRGEAAGQWMKIAQAFAGPPEEGPGPGERIVSR